jgi:hypothetical protein
MEQYCKVLFENPRSISGIPSVQYTDVIPVIIDDIPCLLDFGIRKGYWWFRIEDRDIDESNVNSFNNHTYYEKGQLNNSGMFEDFDDTAEITPEIIQTFIKIILNVLETLKFSKIVGHFILKNIYQKQICHRLVFKDYMENENKDDKCCVCLDYTETKTPCGHILCIPCWIKIKNKRCPLCREGISFFRDDDDDS